MTVTVYSKPGCPGCVQTKRDLNKKGVVFNEVALTPELAISFRETKNIASAPVVESNGVFWGGYDPDKIQAYT